MILKIKICFWTSQTLTQHCDPSTTVKLFSGGKLDFNHT